MVFVKQATTQTGMFAIDTGTPRAAPVTARAAKMGRGLTSIVSVLVGCWKVIGGN